MPTTSAAYPPEYFDKADSADDELFYAEPRYTVHIDDGAIATLRNLYAELLADGMTILDLMSSWRSHLPATLPQATVIGLGLNADEMAANPQLDRFFVQNLNATPELPLIDDTFDAVLCAVSVQYLQSPLELFADVYRILKPGGRFIVSFSNRCFPTKAVAAWLYSGDMDHVALVNSYFRLSAPWSEVTARVKPAGDNPPSDPLYILWASKPLTA